MYRLLALCALAAACLDAQYAFTNGVKPASVAVAGLPAAAAGNKGTIMIVSDGATASDCTTGSGALQVPCISNGLAWISLDAALTPTTPGLVTSLSTVGAFGPASALMPNPSYPKTYGLALAATTTDIYTVPSNRKALVYAGSYGNFGGNTVTVTAEAKIGGNYYPISSPTAETTNTALTLTAFFPIVLSAGQSLSVLTSATGLSIWFGVVEFDATSPLRSVSLTTVSTGDNTLYTCCGSGTTAQLLPAYPNAGYFGSVYYSNASGGTRTLLWYAVPSGGSKGVTNQFLQSATTGNLVTTNRTAPSNLANGDFIVLNLDAGTATQFAWVNVIER